jgi:hypothetical protein
MIHASVPLILNASLDYAHLTYANLHALFNTQLDNLLIHAFARSTQNVDQATVNQTYVNPNAS